MDYHAHPELRTREGCKVQVPCTFIAGTKDMVVAMTGGQEKIAQRLEAHCVAGVDVTFVEGAGHWIQQERADVVNAALLRFLHLHGVAAGGSKL